jgi:hypothetical protein
MHLEPSRLLGMRTLTKGNKAMPTTQSTRPRNFVTNRFVVAVASMLVGAVLVGAVWWSVAGAQTTQPSWLFSQTSTGGTFAPTGAGEYTLTLTGVDSFVTAFTDRPVRDATIVDLADFVAAWPDAFASSAPNAVLVEHQPSGQSDSTVVTMYDPVLAGDTLNFRVVALRETNPENFVDAATMYSVKPPTSFGTSSLFIDDGGSICTSNVTSGFIDDGGDDGGNICTSNVTSGFID